MKKLILALLSLMILTSCGSDSTTNINTKNVSSEGFSMDVPTAWVAVDPAALPSVQNGSIALALTSPEISSGFANNLTILKDKLNEKISSKKYSIVNYALTTGSYRDFVKLSERSVTFADKDESNIYTFEAKYNVDTPKQKFIQTSKVCGDTVYLVTFGLGLSVSTTKYEDLIQTFACK